MHETTSKCIKNHIKIAQPSTCFSKICREHAPDSLAAPPEGWLIISSDVSRIFTNE